MLQVHIKDNPSIKDEFNELIGEIFEEIKQEEGSEYEKYDISSQIGTSKQDIKLRIGIQLGNILNEGSNSDRIYLTPKNASFCPQPKK